MEVHKHSHSAPHKKKWTGYLLEFFMLFFAVFLGFVAENIRENYVEREREERYAHSLYEDLKVDTSLLKAAIKERHFIIPKIDSFRMMVHTMAIEDLPSGTWAYFGRFPTRTMAVSLQDATLQQLLSSGALRLFKKRDVANAIAQYEQAIRYMRVAFSYLELLQSDLVKSRNNLFDAWYLDEIMDISISPEQIDSFKRKSFPLLSTRKEDFIQYANLCQVRSFDLKQVLIRIEAVDKKAQHLLGLLKEEYHLKE